MNVLEASNLEKYYGRNHILKNFSLNVPRGAIFALLGPNGAGKTTFIKSVLNLTAVKSGEIKINGRRWTDFKSREHLAYFPERFLFFSYYTVDAVLRFYGQMYGLASDELQQRLIEAASKAGITNILFSKMNNISKGQIQRVGLASVLMSKSDLLILDEPFSGLDPIGIKEFRDLFLELKNQGKTLSINSHILSEVEKFVDHVAIINDGKLLVSGELKTVIQEKTLEDVFYSLIKGGAL